MPMVEAHIWPHAPEEGPCTLDTTEPPGCTDLIGDQDNPVVPRSQRFLRRHRQKCQTEMHLCSV